MNILLIGGTGVLSTDIMNLCIKRGFDVYIINRGNRRKNLNKKAVFIQANIRNSQAVTEKIRDLNFDIVIDFISYEKWQLENSLSIFQNKCMQFMFISSVAVYDRGVTKDPINESSLMPNPIWDYSKNKLLCENYLIMKCNELGINYTIVRPSITYGNTRIPYGIMPSYGWHWTLIARIQNNKPIIIWDGGETICTITHTLDFAKGVVGLLNNPKSYNESFHIVGDNRYTWNEVLFTISDIVGKEHIPIDIPSEFISAKIPYLKGILIGDRAIDARYDNNKIKIAVPDFSCDIDLKTGISHAIKYYKKNNFLKGIDYKWDAEMDRLIYCYYKKTNPKKLKELNLKYINYLGTFQKDKWKYLMNRYSIFSYILYLITLIVRILKKAKNIFISKR